MSKTNQSTLLPIETIAIQLNSSLHGLIILDDQFKIMKITRGASNMLKVDKSVVGKTFTNALSNVKPQQLTVPKMKSEARKVLQSVLKSGKSQQFYIEIIDQPANSWLLVEVARTIITEDKQVGIVVTVINTSRLKQQEELLNKQLAEISDQNRQWMAMYNSMLESIVTLDTNGRVLSANPATEKITGIKASDSIGRHIGELFPKVDATVPGVDRQGRSGLDQTLEEMRPSDLFEAIVSTRDGRHIWINYTYIPLKDPKGKTTALVRVTSDVSTVKAVEQMKNDFVSIASHELRTPLGVINSYLTLFLNGQLGQLTEDQRTYLQRVYHASGDMSALVEDLLNMSRIEGGRLEVAEQPFNLVELIDEVVSHLDQRLANKHIKVKVRRPSRKVIVHADRQKVEQALTNIIDNAIKYTYDNGVINVGIKAEKGIATVSVKDSGVGIKPENLSHIFEKFYREGNPLSVKEGGSGLGLYISRKLIELHGGSISVSSKWRSGSTFSITLPTTGGSKDKPNSQSRN